MTATFDFGQRRASARPAAVAMAWKLFLKTARPSGESAGIQGKHETTAHARAEAPHGNLTAVASAA